MKYRPNLAFKLFNIFISLILLILIIFAIFIINNDNKVKIISGIMISFLTLILLSLYPFLSWFDFEKGKIVAIWFCIRLWEYDTIKIRHFESFIINSLLMEVEDEGKVTVIFIYPLKDRYEFIKKILEENSNCSVSKLIAKKMKKMYNHDYLIR